MDDANELVVENKQIHHLGISGYHLMAHLQYCLCHFRNLQGRKSMLYRLGDHRLLCAIKWASLYEFWSWQPETVTNSLMSFNSIKEVGDEVLVLLEGLLNVGLFLMRDETGMGAECLNLILDMNKGRYKGHLKWDRKGKYQTEWRNIYEAGELEIQRTIYDKGKIKMVFTNYPTSGPWFVKLISGSKKITGILRDQDL